MFLSFFNYICNMEEFALCIEYILLNRDQTTIPGLGTFVVHQQSARYDIQEEIFLPPLRVVQYIQQENYEKGSEFVTSLMQIYNLNKARAEEKLNLWVTDFYQQLEDCGCLDLGCIGSFCMSEEHTLNFTSSASGITSPAFYALDTFHIRPLAPIEEEKTERKKEKKTSITTTDSSIIIRLNRKMLQYAAVAVTVVAMAFSFTVPVENATELGMQPMQQSKLFIPSNLANIVSPQSHEQQSIVAEEAQVEQSTQAETVVAETEAEQVAEAEQGYCIVMASAISRKNAARYAETLKKRGFDSARVLEGKMTRVVVGIYNTEEEAQTAASEIHDKSTEYKGAWILKLK